MSVDSTIPSLWPLCVAVLAMVAVAGCGPTPPPGDVPGAADPSILRQPFGTTAGGQAVELFTLTSHKAHVSSSRDVPCALDPHARRGPAASGRSAVSLRAWINLRQYRTQRATCADVCGRGPSR